MGIELTPAGQGAAGRRKGYDPVLGARPLRRTIQREIEDALSEKILFGELRAGQIVVVDVEGEGENQHFIFRGAAKGGGVPEMPPVETAGAASDGDGHGGRGHRRLPDHHQTPAEAGAERPRPLPRLLRPETVWAPRPW